MGRLPCCPPLSQLGYGPTASTRSTAGLQTVEGDPEGATLTAQPRCLMPCAVKGAHSSEKPPSPRFASARVLTGLYSAFSNPALERLGYGMANMRLISRDAELIGTTVSLLV